MGRRGVTDQCGCHYEAEVRCQSLCGRIRSLRPSRGCMCPMWKMRHDVEVPLLFPQSMQIRGFQQHKAALYDPCMHLQALREQSHEHTSEGLQTIGQRLPFFCSWAPR
jgi:hypothetical protein